jgi:hypothetical protein
MTVLKVDIVDWRLVFWVDRFDPVMVEKVESPVRIVERFDPIMVEKVERPLCRVEKLKAETVDRVE